MVSTAAVAVAALLLAVVGAKPQTSGCPMDKFDCRNGKCISGSRWCDGIDNCGNNADELTCRVCLSGSLKCKASNQCIPPGSRCDGITQCLDGSDERGCENITTGRYNLSSFQALNYV
ncbi:hypothetical protein ONE63_002638 [Megalurothrips usitatus]|uniref:Uncharacterized protein n=1 Tax=Megalurothrips usitatus TaxID=439358 RepID=A0AAV7XCH8_9NEOP|nr:hypothetical protein ONE63_002638 [Megalurothrips usitatus]